MSLPVLLTLGVLVGCVGCLIFTSLSADAVLFAGLAVLFVTGVVDGRAAFAGFSNEGMMTVGALFIVAAGLRQTGAVNRLSGALLGKPAGVRVVLARLTFPVAIASAFLNNTPIVAALAPGISEWSRRNHLAASKFLIPLSYATILGGTITVIGTSTNLVVTGLVEKNVGHHPGLVSIGIFDIAGVGFPLAILGCAMIVLLAPWMLPDRRPAISTTDDPREYTVELLVQSGTPMEGATIEGAGLRNLPGGYLIEVDRGGTVMPAVEPTTRLRAGDRLVFVGDRTSVLDLKRLPGLTPAPDQLFKLQSPDGERCLVEAVVSRSNPVLGRTIRDGRFRSTFNAVVVAVARDGERIQGKIGDIVLQAGDVLLLEAHPSWVEGQRRSRDFYLSSEVEDSADFRHERAPAALVILVLMVTAAATGFTGMFQASLVAAFAMMATGCCSAIEARRSIDWATLVAIASSFGIGEGIRLSGADAAMAEVIVGLGADGPWTALAAIYVGTALLTELITNNAAAALMFPFALSVSAALGVSPMPFVVAVMYAASASFATPIGYQTNLMVYGPGGYRFSDYLRMGTVLQVGAACVTLTLIPWWFPF